MLYGDDDYLHRFETFNLLHLLGLHTSSVPLLQGDLTLTRDLFSFSPDRRQQLSLIFLFLSVFIAFLPS